MLSFFCWCLKGELFITACILRTEWYQTEVPIHPCFSFVSGKSFMPDSIETVFLFNYLITNEMHINNLFYVNR